MTQTALDELVGQIAESAHFTDKSLDDVVRIFVRAPHHLFKKAFQDPRYIAYCKEQEARESGGCVIMNNVLLPDPRPAGVRIYASPIDGVTHYGGPSWQHLDAEMKGQDKTGWKYGGKLQPEGAKTATHLTGPHERTDDWDRFARDHCKEQDRKEDNGC